MKSSTVKSVSLCKYKSQQIPTFFLFIQRSSSVLKAHINPMDTQRGANESSEGRMGQQGF